MAIEIVQGATFDYPFKITHTNVTTGVVNPVDITGASIKVQIRKNFADYEDYVHADLSTLNGKIVITDAVNGEGKFAVNATETRSWKFDTGFLEFEITYANGQVRKVSTACVLLREYTRQVS